MLAQQFWKNTPLPATPGAKFTEPPLLAVEIRSPSTALIDLSRKKAAYERFGIESYWIVNPDPDRPSLTVFQRRDGHDVQAIKVTGNDVFLAERPFRVEIVPARLLAGLPRRTRD